MKEDRESAQKKFRDACKAAKLTDIEMREFSHYCHNNNLLNDYMTFDEIKRMAVEWKNK